MDGYSDTELTAAKYFDMKNLLDKQEEVNKNITDILSELDSLPEIPRDIDFWIESMSDQDGYNFTLSDFSKMFSINRKYKSLIEERDNTNRKIKIAVIDNLIDMIKGISK